ncbi:hypothetical protein ACE83Q_01590 [Dellaglioa sp. P0083]|uniref:hypothetical protein n=1 Tax=Dellaglioa kimchii TaxID=3344667 RepID=UPI0038D48738
MWLVVKIVTVVVLMIIIILNYNRLKRNRQITILKNKSKLITDNAVEFALNRLHGNEYGINSEILRVTEIVSKVWGKRVMVFEYQFQMKSPSEENIGKIRNIFFNLFEEFEMMNLVKKSVEAKSAFEVTDLWYLDGILHLEVAHLVNVETIMYTKDLKKV